VDKAVRRLSLAEQTASHLREILQSGRWAEKLPGIIPLSKELRVSPTTARSALLLLETEGSLASRGLGRSRALASHKSTPARRTLRVGILLHDAPAQQISRYIFEIRHELEVAGHEVFFAQKSQVELNFNVTRISRHVRETPADAWLVSAGSKEVLTWFSKQTFPFIALFGRARTLPVAYVGPDKGPAFVSAIDQLVKLGHRRIVLICRKPRRLPEPGRVERIFLTELAAHGVPVGDYNLPDWDETPKGLHSLMESLFRVTPPTALIVDEAPVLASIQQFLAQRKLQIPEHVSLIATDRDSNFDWCSPQIAHFHWQPDLVARRVVNWASAISRGREDLKQTIIPAEFIPSGTIGPARRP